MEKEEARRVLRSKVFAEIGPLVDAQIANAKGLKYLVVRDKKTGKFLRVAEGTAKLATGEELIEIWEKDPSIHAFTDLMNRAIDKPAEHVELDANVTTTVNIAERLAAGRARVAAARAVKGTSGKRG